MPNQDFSILRYPLSWRSWRFRLVVAVLIFIFFVRLVWGWQANRIWQQQRSLARARGEPTTVAEVHFETLADSENAWKLQDQAKFALVNGVQSPGNSNDDYKDYPPYPSFWMKRAAASEAAHSRVFALARQARSLPKAQTRDRLESPVIDSILKPNLSQTRQLANTLCDGALYSHLNGNDVEAIERIRDTLHLARSLRQDPVLISQLVAIGIEALATQKTLIIAPGLRPQGTATTQPATNAQIRQLIAELLDERAAWKGFEQCLPIERIVEDDVIAQLAAPTWMLKPISVMESVRGARNVEIEIEASHLRTKPGIDAVLSRIHPEQSPFNPLMSIFGGKSPAPTIPRYSRWFLIGSNDLSRTFETQIRGLSERRVAAISLAAQLYRADHGKWPEKLTELAPAYIPAVPTDLYHDDGRLLGYAVQRRALPDGSDRPLVYFEAGPDNPSLILSEPMYGWSYSGVKRQYRDLTRFVPKLPSTQGVNSDPTETNGPGK